MYPAPPGYAAPAALAGAPPAPSGGRARGRQAPAGPTTRPPGAVPGAPGGHPDPGWEGNGGPAGHARQAGPAGPAGQGAPGGPADARYRFLARFGATILSGGIAAIPTSLYHYQAELGLIPQEVWFVGYILAHRWTDALPYPSLRQMSRRSGISTQMLHRYKQSLIEKGYLSIIPRHRPSGGRTSNFYDFSGLFARLEAGLHRDRRDPAWQPTADELEAGDGDDDDDDEGAGEVDVTRRAARAPAPAPVPASQHETPPAVVRWADVMARGRQRALSAPRQRTVTGAADAGLSGDTLPPAPAPVSPAGPQESRLIRQGERNETGARRTRQPAPVGAATTTKRFLQNDGERNVARNEPAATPTAPAPVVPATTATIGGSPGDPASACWASACATLAAGITPAAFNAWLRPLVPIALTRAPAAPASGAQVSDGDAPTATAAPGGGDPLAPGAPGAPGVAGDGASPAERLVLACRSNFQREHVVRRYRAAIEAAAGVGCELIVYAPDAASETAEAAAPAFSPARYHER